MTVAFRFPPDLERRLGEAARRRGVSRSDVAREAIERLLSREERAQEMTAFEQLAPWIGSIRSGGKFPARDIKKHVAEYIEEKHRARRPH